MCTGRALLSRTAFAPIVRAAEPMMMRSRLPGASRHRHACACRGVSTPPMRQDWRPWGSDVQVVAVGGACDHGLHVGTNKMSRSSGFFSLSALVFIATSPTPTHTTTEERKQHPSRHQQPQLGTDILTRRAISNGIYYHPGRCASVSRDSQKETALDALVLLFPLPRASQ